VQDSDRSVLVARNAKYRAQRVESIHNLLLWNLKQACKLGNREQTIQNDNIAYSFSECAKPRFLLILLLLTEKLI
jgi:hypothetical protein